MERQREPVVFAWDGPLPRRDLPDEVLYDVVLTFRHAGGPQVVKAVREALAGVAGDARARRVPMLGARVTAEGGVWRLSGRVKDTEARVRVHHRVKGKAVERLVRALSRVEDARDLRIEATRERYLRPYTSVGPCSPCAARAFPSR